MLCPPPRGADGNFGCCRRVLGCARLGRPAAQTSSVLVVDGAGTAGEDGCVYVGRSRVAIWLFGLGGRGSEVPVGAHDDYCTVLDFDVFSFGLLWWR